MAIKSTMPFTSIFSKIPEAPDEVSRKENKVIDVGGEQFHAFAAALIDNLKTSLRTNEASLKKILESFFSHSHQLPSNQGYLMTPAERIANLIKGTRRSELVEHMAHVLRQVAVDTIYAQPLNYRPVFENLSPETSKGYLRQPTTRLPSGALSALTECLGVNLTLLIGEHDKEFKKRERYENDAYQSPKVEVVVHVQGDYYFPEVLDKKANAYLGTVAVKPVNKVAEQSGTLHEIMTLIDEANKEILLSYEQTRRTLSTMVAAGEISKKDLINYFITFLPANNTSFTSKAEFFAKLEQRDRKCIAVDAGLGSEKQEISLLINTLAGWISTGEIEADRLFKEIDNKPETSPRV